LTVRWCAVSASRAKASGRTRR